MKAVRILSIIVLAGMLAGTLALAFPGVAQAQGPNPPGAPAGQEPPASQVERLEKAYQRERKALELQAKRLTGADEQAQNFAERIAKLKSQGKDTTALEAALAEFKEALIEAQTTHDKAAPVLKTHAGFDNNGKVTDIQKARETAREAEKLLRDAHRDLQHPARELARAFRAFIRDNRKNK